MTNHWQTVLPDGTAIGDIRYTLLTNDGALLYVQSRGIRHGSAQVRTAASELDWLNKGIFIDVAGRQAASVIYETYLVA